VLLAQPAGSLDLVVIAGPLKGPDGGILSVAGVDHTSSGTGLDVKLGHRVHPFSSASGLSFAAVLDRVARDTFGHRPWNSRNSRHGHSAV
jgi:hypothetical protein